MGLRTTSVNSLNVLLGGSDCVMMNRVTSIFSRARLWYSAPKTVHMRGMSSRPVQPGHWDPHVTRVKHPIPPLPNRKPLYIAGGASLVALWYVLSAYFNNKERVGSSVLRMVSQRVRSAPEVYELLGEPVRIKRSMFGDPWIEGIINPLKGKVDMSFEVVGPRGVGKVYFTSVRKHKTDPFELLRFLVVPHDDTSRAISLLSHGIEHNMLNSQSR